MADNFDIIFTWLLKLFILNWIIQCLFGQFLNDNLWKLDFLSCLWRQSFHSAKALLCQLSSRLRVASVKTEIQLFPGGSKAVYLCRKEGGEKRLLTKSSLSLLLFCQPQLYFGGKSKQSLFKTLRGKVTSGPYWKSFLSTPGKTLFSFVLSSLVICRRIFPNKTQRESQNSLHWSPFYSDCKIPFLKKTINTPLIGF